MSGAMPLDTSPSISDQSAQVFFVPSTNGASGIDNSSQILQGESLPRMPQQGGMSSSENTGGGNSVLLTASDILQSLSMVPNGLAEPESQSQHDMSVSSVANADTANPSGGQETVEITAKSIVILTPKGQGQISFSNSRLADSQPAKELMVQGVPLNMQPIAATSVPCTTMATLPPGSIIVTLPHEMENQNGVCSARKMQAVKDKSILGREKQKRKDGVVCDVCSAGFSTKHSLLRHKQLHKADTEEDHRPACELCGKRFHQMSDLRRHVHTHTGTEPYRCQLCGRGFLRRSDLSTHLRFHNKAKPFQCALCNKTYYQSGDLKRHIRRSHEQTADLACPLCEKMCATERSFQTHLRAQHNSTSVLMTQHTGQLRSAMGRGQTSVTSVQEKAGQHV
ncbi:zinc finger and BTB domain-containing protein 18.3-like [Branchiostoma floridae]|uniref:Zinc finger and BTB domain-containing protein 18.3-like n=1 Tax=Branchiostoma floridae TaxID=7739 RepID=A0A9J7MLY7_BRAFL|nr:zinc finger and BTB domain-containing protein 18.3-like [Branchiostoma floridae]XP_035671689.1 zinc finger and BTB domain-containing protein 18.3-like [Branchiostoma floridae]